MMNVVILPWAILATVFFSLMFVTAVVGAILFFAGRPGSGVRRVGGALGFVCGGLLLFLLAFGVSIIGVRSSVETATLHSALPATPMPPSAPNPPPLIQEVDTIRLPDGAEATLPADAAEASATALPIAPQNTDFIASREQSAHATAGGPTEVAVIPTDPTIISPQDDRSVSSPESSRPDWTNEPEAVRGDVRRIVVSGQQFATIEQARNSAFALAWPQLERDLRDTYGLSARSDFRGLTVDEVRRLAVRQEFVETVDRDFGNFFAPMHRVWWQVELSPAVRTELFARCKQSLQESRSLFVVAGLVAMTAALAGWSLITRRRPA